MRPAIPVIHNGDSYLFHVTDDWTVFGIERFANNQNVIPEQVPLNDVEPELQHKFQRQLEREKKARPTPIS